MGKTLFTVLLGLLFAASSNAQRDTIFLKERKFYSEPFYLGKPTCPGISFDFYKDSTGTYIIVYEFSWDNVMMPATMNAKPHFNATANVYEISSAQIQKIGNPISVIYVKGGCFEGNPEMHVNQAKNQSKLNH